MSIETADPHALTLEHERIATEVKHWVRAVAACNSRCVFCLDAEAQDGRILKYDDVCREILRGREEKGATRLVISGGEASMHPRFADLIRYGKSVGYRWVQTVTNGRLLARRALYLAVVEAGLDEITFSLHGHTAELHDRLTGSPGAFEELMRAMLRAVRDGRVVVNVDVVINKQNVAHVEKIVALCARVGVREFDLLHVIPQGEAFANADTLFYDVDAHAEDLRRVFKLARQPGFHIWTNRFPVAHLEGMEELIQDPHKMLDEVGGRRVQFRRYLDGGAPIDCRDPKRCPHCFIEPFCSTLDQFVADQHAARFDVWWVGDKEPSDSPLPVGCRYVGVSRLPTTSAHPLYVKMDDYTGVSLPEGTYAVATQPAHLPALLAAPVAVIEVQVDRALADALLAQPTWLDDPRVVLSAPTYLTMAEVTAKSPAWADFFQKLGRLGVRVANLPACLCPGATLIRPLRVIDATLFHDDGKLAIDAYVDHYIHHDYRAKSLRCQRCPATTFCAGAHIQALRAQGFAVLQPLTGEWAIDATAQLAALHPEPSPRLSAGAPPQPGSVRIPVADNPPVPFIDTAPGRRS